MTPICPTIHLFYSLVSDNTPNDNASFRIANDQLQIITSPNFEVKPSYAVRIRTTDKDGLFLDRTFIIKINDINEPPVAINLSCHQRRRKSCPANSLVGTLTTSDPDIGDTFTYAFVAGAGSTDNAAFTLVKQQRRDRAAASAIAPDFEAKPSYSNPAPHHRRQGAIFRAELHDSGHRYQRAAGHQSAHRPAAQQQTRLTRTAQPTR